MDNPRIYLTSTPSSFLPTIKPRPPPNAKENSVDAVSSLKSSSYDSPSNSTLDFAVILKPIDGPAKMEGLIFEPSMGIRI